ncbi:dTDP-4-dehydrorhamnose reductase [Chloroflexota bacterium]
MKVMVIGANGQLGADLCQELNSVELVPLKHSDIEVADMDSIRQAFSEHRPEVVINTAAFHRVDDCESDQDKAFLVNTRGAGNVAVSAQESGAKLVYISTDYIFGGESKPRTTSYTEFDTPVPPNVYGRSKLAGEGLVKHLCHRYFIIRTSGLFGVAGSSGKGQNFVETMLRLAKEKSELRVVDDQIFSPTYTKDLAGKIAQLINTKDYGIFHVTNRGACSWCQFAVEILNLVGSKTPVIPITSAEYPQAARRPAYSVMDNCHLRLIGMDDMRPWAEALRDYMVAKGHIIK